MTAPIESVLQSSELGAVVTLFELDCTSIVGGPLLRFCSSLYQGSPVQFGGEEYAPVDCDSDGWQFGTEGALPQPRFQISNAERLISSYLHDFDDLLGCRLRRIVTLDRYLDTGTDPDSSAWLRNELYEIEQKTSEDLFRIEFRLASVLDREGRRMPGRQVQRDTCGWRYRRWDPAANGGAGDWIYAPVEVQCPYTGAALFDRDNNALPAGSQEQDLCSKSLNGCKLRFPKDGGLPLPFGGFPGLGAWR